MSTDAPPTESGFLFADIARLHRLTEAHGDHAAVELATLFCRAVGDLIPDEGWHRAGPRARRVDAE